MQVSYFRLRGLGIRVSVSQLCIQLIFLLLSESVEPSSQTLQPITLELRRRKIPKGGDVPLKRPRIEKNLCEFSGIQLSYYVCTYKYKSSSSLMGGGGIKLPWY